MEITDDEFNINRRSKGFITYIESWLIPFSKVIKKKRKISRLDLIMGISLLITNIILLFFIIKKNYTIMNLLLLLVFILLLIWAFLLEPNNKVLEDKQEIN